MGEWFVVVTGADFLLPELTRLGDNAVLFRLANELGDDLLPVLENDPNFAASWKGPMDAHVRPLRLPEEAIPSLGFPVNPTPVNPWAMRDEDLRYDSIYVGFPEVEEGIGAGKGRNMVIMLPQKFLDEMPMVRHEIEDIYGDDVLHIKGLYVLLHRKL